MKHCEEQDHTLKAADDIPRKQVIRCDGSIAGVYRHELYSRSLCSPAVCTGPQWGASAGARAKLWQRPVTIHSCCCFYRTGRPPGVADNQRPLSSWRQP